MAATLAEIAAYFHLSTMANIITTVLWMATRRSGVPRLTISRRMVNGDCAMTRLVFLIALIIVITLCNNIYSILR